MKNLSKYERKYESKKPRNTTTISIEVDQKKIIDENNINLSELIRDLLEDFFVRLGYKKGPK